MSGIKAEKPEGILEATADKGYIKEEDMLECLEKGIIPHVILPDGKDVYELEISYEETGEKTEKGSRKAEDIRKCLHAGEIPEAYEEVIEKIEVAEKRKLVYEDEPEEEGEVSDKCEEEMKEGVLEGYFVRDPERNLVYCPGGEILRQKSKKKNGSIRYANKTACRRCPNRNKYYKGKNEWKEIDFPKEVTEKPCKTWMEEEGEGKENKQGKKKKKGHYEKKKVVKIIFRPGRKKMEQRKCISEHPFGTIKRWMNAGYYLLRGKRKTEGETALMCLGYNLERAKNLLGFESLMEAVA